MYVSHLCYVLFCAQAERVGVTMTSYICVQEASGLSLDGVTPSVLFEVKPRFPQPLHDGTVVIKLGHILTSA
jgi:hypothetical protein